MLVLQVREWMQIWKKVLKCAEHPSKRYQKNGDKSTVAMLKWNGQPQRKRRPVLDASPNTRQLGCVFQDMEPPKLSSILRKSSDMQKPIQRVKFTKAIARHTKIRDQNSSLGYVWPGEPHQRSPTLQNLRIGRRSRQNGESNLPAKQRGSWPIVC